MGKLIFTAIAVLQTAQQSQHDCPPSLPSHPSRGSWAKWDTFSLVYRKQEQDVGCNNNWQIEGNNAWISIVDKSLPGIKNELFPLARASRPQYISHFKLTRAKTGLVSVSSGLVVRLALELSLPRASDQRKVDSEHCIHLEAGSARMSSTLKLQMRVPAPQLKNTDANPVPLLSFSLSSPAFWYCKHMNLQQDWRLG